MGKVFLAIGLACVATLAAARADAQLHTWQATAIGSVVFEPIRRLLRTQFILVAGSRHPEALTEDTCANSSS